MLGRIRKRPKTIDEETKKEFERRQSNQGTHAKPYNYLFDLFITIEFFKLRWKKLQTKCKVNKAIKKKHMVVNG